MTTRDHGPNEPQIHKNVFLSNRVDICILASYSTGAWTLHIISTTELFDFKFKLTFDMDSQDRSVYFDTNA